MTPTEKPLPRHSATVSACKSEQRSWELISEPLQAVLLELAEGKRKWPLYLHGSPGTGKTSASLAMLDNYGRIPANWRTDAVIQDWFAGFIRVRSLNVLIEADQNRFQWYRDGDAGTIQRASLIRVIDSAPLLVLDEIGVGKEASTWVLNTMLDILDRRCGNPAKPTIITGNAKPSELARLWDDRVADRVLRGTRYEHAGASKRTGR